MQHIGCQTPNEVLALDDIETNGYGEAAVVGSTDVHRYRRYTCRCRLLYRDEFRIGLADVVVESERQTIVEHKCVQTEVVCLRTLPLQVVVAPLRNHGCKTKRVWITGVVIVNVVGKLGVNVLVARITECIAQLEVADKLVALEEVLVVDIPCHTYRVSGRERIVDTIHRSTVCTYIEVEQIAHVVSIVAIEIEAG